MTRARVEVAAAVIERPDGAFLMARRPPGKVYAGWWEFPGGKVEAGETARQALDRELHEELGLVVREAHPWLNRSHDYEHARVLLRFFRVVGWEGRPHPHEGQEALAWVHAAHPEVDPILPANGPILRGLQLPLTYAISAAADLGTEVFLDRLTRALGSGLRLVQLREKQLAGAAWQRLAERTAELCRTHAADLLLNGDIALAERLGVGVHLPAAQLMATDARPDLPWVGASCHNARELAQAAALDLDFVVLGTIRPTVSHPGARPLGWEALGDLIADFPLPVYALGGLTMADLPRARQLGAHGVALRSAAWPA